MKNIGIIEHLLLPDYRDRKQITWGVVKVDPERCTGCSICVKICPADSLMIENKKAHIKPVTGVILKGQGISQCMACGDCSAICPTGAITIERSYRWTKFFKTINRGELSKPRL